MKLSFSSNIPVYSSQCDSFITSYSNREKLKIALIINSKKANATATTANSNKLTNTIFRPFP
jgi:hypothetical protein